MLHLCHLIKKNDLRASGKKEEENQQKEGNLIMFLRVQYKRFLATLYKGQNAS